MAKIMVFDNNPEETWDGTDHVDTAGNIVPYNGKGGQVSGGPNLANGLSQSSDDPAHTMPVRAFTAKGEIRNIGWEFLFMQRNGNAGAFLGLRWWMEFYNDKLVGSGAGGGEGGQFPGANPDDIGQVLSPRNRLWNGIPLSAPWMRETALVDSGSNDAYGNRNLDIYGVTRRMTLQSRNAVEPPVEDKNADCLYVPLSIHTAWVRLALWAVADDDTVTDGMDWTNRGANPHLRIYAHIGGHDEKSHLEDEGGLPYAYDARNFE